jgi:hypothetical protein
MRMKKNVGITEEGEKPVLGTASLNVSGGNFQPGWCYI